MEVINKLSTTFHEAESEHQSQEAEISAAAKSVISELHFKYFDVVGYNKKRILGTGRYSKAFLLQLESNHKGSSSKRLHDFCVAWDEHMRKWLSS
ncbi:unnamed protein product, partial [Cuscuta europaea]